MVAWVQKPQVFIYLFMYLSKKNNMVPPWVQNSENEQNSLDKQADTGPFIYFQNLIFLWYKASMA